MQKPSKRTRSLLGMLALAHYFEKLVREGKARDYAHVARLTGMTRARVCQIVGLMMLPAGVQKSIVMHRDSDSSERSVRPLLQSPLWEQANSA